MEIYVALSFSFKMLWQLTLNVTVLHKIRFVYSVVIWFVVLHDMFCHVLGSDFFFGVSNFFYL